MAGRSPQPPEQPGWGEHPMVSVVVPMFNELGAIDECLDGFAAQTWPHEHLEVLVVDGASTDGCREAVARRAVDEPWIRIVDNPARRIPAGCNRGLAEAKGDIVCFFSSHGIPSPGFVERVVATLADTGATGVGGVYRHEGTDPASRAIGLAMASPFGMASPHRFASRRAVVDTISHPAYRIDAVRAVGGFDEEMQRNEDYELNWRLREEGAVLVFDPSIESTYRPRRSLGALSRQFFWYGCFKARMLIRHPRSVRPRHLVPPAAVAAAIAGVPAAVAFPRTRPLAVAAACAYAGVVAAGVVSTHPRQHDADPRVLAAAFCVMHASWGAGFLASVTGTEPK